MSAGPTGPAGLNGRTAPTVRPVNPAPPTPPDPQARLAASRAAIRRQLQAQAMAPSTLERVARDHPWALLGGGALGGALVVLLRPWRWLPRPPVLASMLSHLAWRALSARPSGRTARSRGPTHDQELR